MEKNEDGLPKYALIIVEEVHMQKVLKYEGLMVPWFTANISNGCTCQIKLKIRLWQGDRRWSARRGNGMGMKTTKETR